jgi:DNA polymerase III alpha subunit
VNVNEYGQVVINELEAFDALYSARITSLDNVYIDNLDTVERFNNSISKNADRIDTLKFLELPNISKENFDRLNQQQWFMPEEYKNFPIVHWLHLQCKSDEELKRVDQELELFIQHNMLDLLFYLKYLVDTMRNNNVLWGVGRGSSVASYVLYLLGVHKIDSIKYGLDIHEFLKGEKDAKV